MLFEGIYSRLEGADVTVVTDGTRSEGAVRQARFSVVRWPFLRSRWGVLIQRACDRTSEWRASCGS